MVMNGIKFFLPLSTISKADYTASPHPLIDVIYCMLVLLIYYFGISDHGFCQITKSFVRCFTNTISGLTLLTSFFETTPCASTCDIIFKYGS